MIAVTRDIPVAKKRADVGAKYGKNVRISAELAEELEKIAMYLDTSIARAADQVLLAVAREARVRLLEEHYRREKRHT